MGGLKCVDIEELSYVDPADDSLSLGHGIALGFQDGERAVFRLAGTGSSGATLRVYLEAHETRKAKFGQTTAQALAKVAAAALEASAIEQLTGREAPTVIT
jgi:phosphoglucomutase